MTWKSSNTVQALKIGSCIVGSNRVRVGVVRVAFSLVGLVAHPGYVLVSTM